MMLYGVLGIMAQLSPIADVRVGDDGTRSRVEVLCTQVCDAEPIDENTFLVTWAEGDFVADVSGRSAYLKKIHVETQKYGAALRVEMATKPRSVTAKKCGPARLCFDFDFSSPEKKPKPQVSLAALENDLENLMVRAGYQPVEIAVDALASHQVTPNPANTAPMTAAPTAIAAVAAAPIAPAPPKNVEKRATCIAAEQALAADAWNLGAYRTVALCQSTKSDQATAARYLRRLQTYADGSAVQGVMPALR